MEKVNKLANIIDKSKKDLKIIFFVSLKQFHIRVYLAISVFINALIWIVVRYIDSEIDTKQMALHYNVESGIDYYGATEKIYIIPLLGILVFFVNFFLFTIFSRHKDRRFISHILLSMVVIVNIILLIGAISVYLINFI